MPERNATTLAEKVAMLEQEKEQEKEQKDQFSSILETLVSVRDAALAKACTIAELALTAATKNKEERDSYREGLPEKLVSVINPEDHTLVYETLIALTRLLINMAYNKEAVLSDIVNAAKTKTLDESTIPKALFSAMFKEE